MKPVTQDFKMGQIKNVFVTYEMPIQQASLCTSCSCWEGTECIYDDDIETHMVVECSHYHEVKE